MVSRRTRRASDRPKPIIRPRRDKALEEAIASDSIAIRFQPQIEPATGRIAGVEALARWEGAETPELLFARARAAGLAERLSRHVQATALRMAGSWTGPLVGLGLSINVLPEDLARGGYDDWLLAEIGAAGLQADRLTVEITESGLVTDAKQVAQRLTRLRDAGMSVAVDDFGSGYASHAYLTSLPLDILKIDRGLVTDLVGGARDRIVVKAMINLARDLGLKVVVEGVENTGQLALLAEWGCDLYQGFLGSGALAQEDLRRFVDASLREAA